MAELLEHSQCSCNNVEALQTTLTDHVKYDPHSLGQQVSDSESKESCAPDSNCVTVGNDTLDHVCETIQDHLTLKEKIATTKLKEHSSTNVKLPNGCVKPIMVLRQEETEDPLRLTLLGNNCNSADLSDNLIPNCDSGYGTHGSGSTQSLAESRQDGDETNNDEPINNTLEKDELCRPTSEETVNRTEYETNKPVNNMPKFEPVSSITYEVYQSELQMPDIMSLITKDLSEPYSIYTYRYFIHNWPKLCFLAMDGKCVGAIVCKLDMHKNMVRRGYIAMLAVDDGYRRRKIGSHLVMKAIKAMVADNCDEVVLETEITNKPALRLYENLGFVRDKRLFRYYLNGVDALRLKLWLR